jgi:hypothetical protein
VPTWPPPPPRHRQVEAAGKAEPEFTSVVVDDKGVKVCEVVKTVHVKRLPEGGHGRHHHSQVRVQ